MREVKMKISYNIKNSQFGNNNVMYNTSESKKIILQEEHWEELEDFLNRRLNELEQNQEIYKVAEKTLEYSKQRNEPGLKKFVNANKDAFFTNVLSDVVSSGLLFALGKLFV